MTRVILHDSRLSGRVETSDGLGTVFHVGPSTSLSVAFHMAINAASSSSDELIIACHGYMTHNYDDMCNERARGGFGLQFCRETLRVGNVSATAVLSGYFSKIWLMACGPAGTIISRTRPFCREFACNTNALVIASDATQYYHSNSTSGGLCMQVLRFGAWEGNVYTFHPDGSVTPYTSGVSPLP